MAEIMQAGDGELTVCVPISDLEAILPVLKAKKRFKASEARLAACRKAMLASPIIPKEFKNEDYL